MQSSGVLALGENVRTMSDETVSRSAPSVNADALCAARRARLASGIGTVIERYDFFIYGTAAAVVFGPQFFPNASELAARFASYATFPLGFFALPLGGVRVGPFGDRP